MEPVKLPREVARVLTHIAQTYAYPIRAVVEMFNGKSEADFKELCEYFEQDRSRRIGIIMQALVNGYEVEETPEDKVYQAYKLAKHNRKNVTAEEDQMFWNGWVSGMEEVVRLLDIKIEGVNA